MPRRVLVIIPCLDERESLPSLLADLRALADHGANTLVPLVIDDGSSDGTTAAARALGVRVIRLCSNLGIGGAVQTGLRVAAEEGFDCAVQLDGDGQHPVEEVPALLARLDETPAPDLVVGSRFLRRQGFQSTPTRRLGIGWLSVMLRLFGRLAITDPTSGFRLYGPRALRLFNGRYPYDYPEPEALVLAQRAGLVVVEEPVAMRARGTGHSSISGLGSAYYMLKVTLAIFLDVVRTTRMRPAPRATPPDQPSRPTPPELPWSPSSAATGSLPPSAAASPSLSSASSRESE